MGLLRGKKDNILPKVLLLIVFPKHPKDILNLLAGNQNSHYILSTPMIFPYCQSRKLIELYFIACLNSVAQSRNGGIGRAGSGSRSMSRDGIAMSYRRVEH